MNTNDITIARALGTHTLPAVPTREELAADLARFRALFEREHRENQTVLSLLAARTDERDAARARVAELEVERVRIREALATAEDLLMGQSPPKVVTAVTLLYRAFGEEPQ